MCLLPRGARAYPWRGRGPVGIERRRTVLAGSPVHRHSGRARRAIRRVRQPRKLRRSLFRDRSCPTRGRALLRPRGCDEHRGHVGIPRIGLDGCRRQSGLRQTTRFDRSTPGLSGVRNGRRRFGIAEVDLPRTDLLLLHGRAQETVRYGSRPIFGGLNAIPAQVRRDEFRRT